MRRRTLKTLKLILTLGCIFSLWPLIGGITGIGFGSSPYSPHNKGREGLSEFKGNIEEEGYKTSTIVSSLKVLSRMNKTGVLVINGPTTSYGLQEVLNVLLDFVRKGGSILIADDFGKANTLLKHIWNLALGPVAQTDFSILFNTTSVLCDAKSYQGSPARPTIVKNFDRNIIDPEVKRVQTNFPATFSLKVNETTTVLPPQFGLMTSTNSSWLENDLSSARRGTAEPSPSEWGGVAFPLAVPLPLGKGMGRIMLVSDPDIFSNRLMNSKKNDNTLFSMNIIRWLSATAESGLVIFDESHHSFMPFDPFFGLGLWFSNLTMLSSSWILAPLIPFLTFVFIIGYLPHRKRFRAIILRHEERKATSPSIFSSKVTRYMRRNEYSSAISNLLGVIIRRFSRQYSVEIDGAEELIERLPEFRPGLEENISHIKSFLNTLREVAEGRKKLSKKEFINIMKTYREVKDLLFS